MQGWGKVTVPFRKPSFSRLPRSRRCRTLSPCAERSRANRRTGRARRSLSASRATGTSCRTDSTDESQRQGPCSGYRGSGRVSIRTRLANGGGVWLSAGIHTRVRAGRRLRGSARAWREICACQWRHAIRHANGPTLITLLTTKRPTAAIAGDGRSCRRPVDEATTRTLNVRITRR